ncbi:MAG: tripartite tricarboxylate transporter substrate binding protein [Pseudomonadota bacterium]|nr:tripartite tricarboxylate transporter substrate binding protein [Pseudomonadota bacterium]
MTFFSAPIARRATLGLVAALALGAPAIAPAADAFPSRVVTVHTPFPPGSGPDAILRTITERLSRLWGQPVVVQNRAGAGGFVAMEATRRLAPDGYNLVQLDSEQLVALPLLYKSRQFQTLDIFEPVASIFHTPFLFAVPADSPWKNVSDLVAAAKARPGGINYGSWGVGSPGHLGGEQLELATGTQMQHIAFRDSGQLFTALASGEVAWSLGSIPSSQAMYKAGKIRYLAVAGPRRITQMPEVPTVDEAGGPGDLVQSSFVVLVAPKGMVPTVREKIAADVAQVLQAPDVKARMDTFAFEPITWSPDEVLAQARAKGQMYETLIKRKNISLD